MWRPREQETEADPEMCEQEMKEADGVRGEMELSGHFKGGFN